MSTSYSPNIATNFTSKSYYLDSDDESESSVPKDEDFIPIVEDENKVMFRIYGKNIVPYSALQEDLGESEIVFRPKTTF